MWMFPKNGGTPNHPFFFWDHFNILAQVFQTGDSTYSREPLSTPDHEFGRHTQRLPCPATHYNCWCACNIAAFPSKIPDPCDGLSATCKPFRIDTNPIVIPNWEFFEFFIPSLGFVVSLAGTPTKSGLSHVESVPTGSRLSHSLLALHFGAHHLEPSPGPHTKHIYKHMITQ